MVNGVGMPGRVILASASPRRRDLLVAAGFEVLVRPAAVVELEGGAPPRELVMENAERKAAFVAGVTRGDLVLGADTVVVLDGEILGKPRDLAHAADMLTRLGGRDHEVLTGVCLMRGGEKVRCRFSESTRVVFRPLDQTAISSYLADIDPLDKAGGYAAQEDRGRLIDRIEGSVDNVIGLPVQRVLAAIADQFVNPKAG
jgi:septum formation protein